MLSVWILSIGAAFAAPTHDGLAALRSVFERAPGAKAPSDEVLTQRLVALGAAETPLFFDLVLGEGIDVLMDSSSQPDSWSCSPDHLGQLACAALGRLPHGPVLAHLRERVAARPEREVRVAALRVLASLASADSLDFLFELAAAFGDELDHHAVRDPWKD